MSTRPAKTKCLKEPTPEESEQRLARLHGFEGEQCPRCAARRLVRSGKVYKCDACASDGEYVDGKPVLLHVTEWRPAATVLGGEWVAIPTGMADNGANSRQVGGNHYLSPIQHWDYVVANDIPYLEAQVIKYLTRWRKKNGLEDVYKAQHYLQKLIEVEEAKLKEKPNA